MSNPALLAHGCDSHVHIIGPQTRYPMCPERRYTPPEASVPALQAHLQHVGVQRAVIVQPSVYGHDNRCMLDALAQMAGQARGIAVLPDDVDLRALRTLDAQGVRGVRLNLESVSNHDAQALRQGLQHWGPRLAELGWHVQVFAPIGLIAACAETIRHLPVPCVFDHFALWRDAGCTDAASQTVLQLLHQGHIYLKLSGSYRVPAGAGKALAQIAQRLIDSGADRLLWASDWPHTNRAPGVCALQESPYRDIRAEALLHERADWLRVPAVAQQVLVDNPARLYRFLNV
jgi:2-pyrone-4,6-dicarboxylate lactonase